MSRFAWWTAAVAAAALLTGCGGSSGASDDDAKRGSDDAFSASAPATSSGLPSSLTSQKLDWGRCKGASAPSGRLAVRDGEVPLDWSKPGGETIAWH